MKFNDFANLVKKNSTNDWILTNIDIEYIKPITKPIIVVEELLGFCKHNQKYADGKCLNVCKDDYIYYPGWNLDVPDCYKVE